jgi:hypothetical protein
MGPHYRVMGNYQGSTEELDSDDDVETARALRDTYTTALGSDWKVWIEVQTFVNGDLDQIYALDDPPIA